MKDIFEGLFISIVILFVSTMFVLTLFGFILSLVEYDDTTGTYVTESIEGSEENTKEIKIIYTKESDQSLLGNTSETSDVAVTDNQLDLTDNEEYLLAKICACEAEGCNLDTKIKVIQVVLNRVKNKSFPNTVLKVIYECDKEGNYQFSPVASGGSWYYKEPDKLDYQAVDFVKNMNFDNSKGVLYFESCENEDNWHSRNLTYIDTYDGIRFYK